MTTGTTSLSSTMLTINPFNTSTAIQTTSSGQQLITLNQQLPQALGGATVNPFNPSELLLSNPTTGMTTQALNVSSGTTREILAGYTAGVYIPEFGTYLTGLEPSDIGHLINNTRVTQELIDKYFPSPTKALEDISKVIGLVTPVAPLTPAINLKQNLETQTLNNITDNITSALEGGNSMSGDLNLSAITSAASSALGAVSTSTATTGNKRIIVVTDAKGNQRVMKLVSATAKIQKRRRYAPRGRSGQFDKLMQMAMVTSMMRK